MLSWFIIFMQTNLIEQILHLKFVRNYLKCAPKIKLKKNNHYFKSTTLNQILEIRTKLNISKHNKLK